MNVVLQQADAFVKRLFFIHNCLDSIDWQQVAQLLRRGLSVSLKKVEVEDDIPFRRIFRPDFGDAVIEEQNVFVLRQLLEELIIVIEKQIYDTDVFLSVVEIHES